MIRKKAARKTDAYVSRETIDDSESDSDDGNRNASRHRHDSDDGNRNDTRHCNDSDGDMRRSVSSQGDGSRRSVTLSDSTTEGRVSICEDENQMIRHVS